MLKRSSYIDQIHRYFRSHPIVAILGPRQCGKTTLAKSYCKPHFPRSNYFDLEDPADLARLQEPKLALEPLKNLIVIDEIQRIPELFPILRVLVDQNPDRQFLILGSASRDLVRQSSETLAGRIAYLELTPFSFLESHEMARLWVRGGFPRSYLAESERESYDWREFYISTFLERDIPNLGIQIPPVALRRFWTLLAHYHGNLFNASEVGRLFGASDVTMRRYLDILSGTFMVRQLSPWHENLKKRQVKAPKIYFRDSGILHCLFGIESYLDLQRHLKIGASWEGFALEQILHLFPSYEPYFWGTYSGAELDLLLIGKKDRIGVEFKYMDAPKLTKSMQIAEQDLSLDQLYVIYPGEVDYALSNKIEVRSFKNFLLSFGETRIRKQPEY